MPVSQDDVYTPKKPEYQIAPDIRATTRALCEALDMLIDSLAESVAAYEVARRKIEALTKAGDAPLYHVRG